MKDAKIPFNLMEYGIETWGPVIQKFLDKKYGSNLYRIYVFNDYNFMSPIYKSEVESYSMPILLYHNGHHFDGIKHLASFFGKRYYCLHCESAFSHKQNHNSNCLARCIYCSGMGPEFPCERTPQFERKCNKCSKIFNNKFCYERHIEKKFCDVSKKCDVVLFIVLKILKT
jgi:hypothetical protein